VVLDAENIPFIDVTAVEMLDQEDATLTRVYPTIRAAVDPAQRSSN
jgi:hypothetical protein